MLVMNILLSANPISIEAADMVTVDGLKYVNGDTNLIVYSHGTGSGSYAELDSARMIGGTDIETGLVVMSFRSGGFSWRIGQDRVDSIEPLGVIQLWWDPVHDQFYLDAIRRHELTDNKKELRFLAQRAMKNSQWTGMGSTEYEDLKKLRITPKVTSRNAQYMQQIYNFGKNEFALQVVQISDNLQKFMIFENNKMVYSYDATNISHVDASRLCALKFGNDIFYAYGCYDYKKRIGHAILIGKSHKDKNYIIYVDSDDYYNPGGKAAFVGFEPTIKNGKAINGLCFSVDGKDVQIYELLYNATTDKIEYRE